MDLHNLLEELAADNQPLPKNVGDMTAHEAIHPPAAASSEWRGCVRLGQRNRHRRWGCQYRDRLRSGDGGERRLGLLQDGTVKEMTADEFKSAQKPKDKR